MLLELESEQSIEMLCQKLDINEKQVLLLSKLINKYQGDAIYLQEIAKIFEKGVIEFLNEYLSDLRQLEQKGIIFIEEPDTDSSRELFFRLKLDSIESLSNGEEVKNTISKKETIEDFLEMIFLINESITSRSYNNRFYEKGLKNFSLLLKNNRHFSMVKKIEDYNLQDNMKLVMFSFFAKFLFFDEEEIGIKNFHDLLCNDYTKFRIRLRNESTELQKYELIEFGNSEGFSNTETLKLTKKAKKEFLEEIEFKTSAKAIKNIMLPSKIEEKKLL
jgi:hypothetical protein